MFIYVSTRPSGVEPGVVFADLESSGTSLRQSCPTSLKASDISCWEQLDSSKSMSPSRVVSSYTRVNSIAVWMLSFVRGEKELTTLSSSKSCSTFWGSRDINGYIRLDLPIREPLQYRTASRRSLLKSRSVSSLAWFSTIIFLRASP